MTRWYLDVLGRLTPDELAVSNEAEAIKCAEFDADIESKLGDSFMILQPLQQPVFDLEDDLEDESFDPTDFELETPLTSILEADAVDANGKPIFQASITDSLINAEMVLPTGESTVMAKIL